MAALFIAISHAIATFGDRAKPRTTSLSPLDGRHSMVTSPIGALGRRPLEN